MLWSTLERDLSVTTEWPSLKLARASFPRRQRRDGEARCRSHIFLFYFQQLDTIYGRLDTQF